MVSREQRWFRKILWFDKRTKYEIDFFEFLQPQRTVSVHHRYKSGVFYSEKCKREIQYESGIELDFIKQLEKSDRVKFYFEQPVQIKYWRGRRRQTYTPDFGIYLRSKEFVIAEIKDLPGMLEHRVQMKTEALMDFCSSKGFGLLLTDGRHTIDKLKRVKCNRKLEREILKAIDNNVLRKREYDAIMKNCQSTQNELLKVIIKHNLKYKSYPFKLQHGNKNQIFRQVLIEKKKYEELAMERFSALFKS